MTPGKVYAFTGPAMTALRTVESPSGEVLERYLDAGQNPRDGVSVCYVLGERPEGEVTLTFLDAAGNEIRTFSSEEKKEEKATATGTETGEAEAASETPLAPVERASELKAEKKEEKKEPRVPKEAGLNRFVWDMRYAEPHKVSGYVSGDDNLAGPQAAPGRYQVRLTVGERTATEWLEIATDPRVTATQEDLDAQFELLIRIRDRISDTHDGINTIRNVRRQVEEWERRTEGQPQHDRVVAAGKGLKEKLAAVEEELTQVKAKSRQDTLALPIKLNAKLAFLAGVVASADAAPTRQARDVFAELSARVEELLERLRGIVETDVAAFNALIQEAGVPAIVPSAKAAEKHLP